MTDETNEQLRDRHMATMGPTLGSRYADLFDELAAAHNTWNEFKRLYAGDQETIELLNDWGPAFFARVQEMMWREILPHLCRITDPAKVAGRTNLSIQCLAAEVPDAELRAQLEQLIQDAVEAVSFARPFRNKRLAHRDLPQADSGRAERLTMGSRKQIEDALAALANVLNAISSHFMRSTTAYGHTMEAPGGASYLVHRLRESQPSSRRTIGGRNRAV